MVVNSFNYLQPFLFGYKSLIIFLKYWYNIREGVRKMARRKKENNRN